MSIDEAYGLYDATGLAGLVVSNEVKVAELVEVAITRIEEQNPRLNAVVLPAFAEFFPLVERLAFGELTSLVPTLVPTWAGTAFVDGNVQLVALNPNGLEGIQDFTGHVLG